MKRSTFGTKLREGEEIGSQFPSTQHISRRQSSGLQDRHTLHCCRLDVALFPDHHIMMLLDEKRCSIRYHHLVKHSRRFLDTNDGIKSADQTAQACFAQMIGHPGVFSSTQRFTRFFLSRSRHDHAVAGNERMEILIIVIKFETFCQPLVISLHQ